MEYNRNATKSAASAAAASVDAATAAAAETTTSASAAAAASSSLVSGMLPAETPMILRKEGSMNPGSPAMH